MAFPDFQQSNDDPFGNVENNNMSNQFNPLDDNNNNNPEMTDWNNLGGNAMNNNYQPMDEEEEKRQMKRKEEENERRRVIAEKMDLELKQKQELQEKAIEFLNENERKRLDAIAKRKLVNAKDEEENMANRQLIKEGKKNPWEKVIENITIKESEYKGSKNVNRMRSVIISRKGDDMSQLKK